MTQTREPGTETMTVTITLRTGHREHLRGVDERDARYAKNLFSLWAGLGGDAAPRSTWTESRALDLISEATEVSLTVPYSMIAILTLTPER